MQTSDYLESFLLSIKKNECPDKEILISIAASIKLMQTGESFKKAFKCKEKTGRISLDEKVISEIMPILEIIEEYYSTKKTYTEQKLTTAGERAKSDICDTHKISERTFDKYRALYNEIMAASNRFQLLANKFKK